MGENAEQGCDKIKGVRKKEDGETERKKKDRGEERGEGGRCGSTTRKGTSIC